MFGGDICRISGTRAVDILVDSGGYRDALQLNVGTSSTLIGSDMSVLGGHGAQRIVDLAKSIGVVGGAVGKV